MEGYSLACPLYGIGDFVPGIIWTQAHAIVFSMWTTGRADAFIVDENLFGYRMKFRGAWNVIFFWIFDADIGVFLLPPFFWYSLLCDLLKAALLGRMDLWS